jgi:endonuclease/exonuclease/phosphatase (EEP) superfamily protein YafD
MRPERAPSRRPEPEPAGVEGEESSARILQWPGPRVRPGTDVGDVPAGSAGPRHRPGRPVLVPAAMLLAAWAGTCVLDVVRPEPLDRLVVAAAAVSSLAVVAAIPVVALAIRGRFWITAALAAVASLVPWLFVLGYAAPAGALPADGVRLSVMLLDADGAGADAPSVVAAVARQPVDVLVITETSSLLTHRLTTSGLDPRLEARWVSPPGGSVSGSLCVYSRYPVTAVEQVDGTRWPAVRLTLDVGRGTVSVVAGRASPWEQGTTTWRKDLAALGAAARLPGPAVLAGTLDANAQQPAFRRLTGSGLRDGAAVLGRGVRPTWPSWSPLPLLPLDHVLVGKGVGVRSVGTLAVAGTSHRALVADLVVPGAPRTAPVGD